ncbi:MAG: TonB-dependent receptor [Saprospiraceae bacterium]|nr:TonB-dependent receptor [Saprospiraceae bacterium]MBK7736535.1 TonB-dependent receptor [Saprospiraceae bacterium]MBK7912101.1 TonB-dependent receptor [Saprospiraceae bacterium]
MKAHYILKLSLIYYSFFFSISGNIFAQTVLNGKLTDAKTGEALIGASVLIKGTTQGTTTDFDGDFVLKTNLSLPLVLEFRYSGYATKELNYTEAGKKINMQLEVESILIDVVEVSGQRISDKQKSSPLTVESMDLIAIKETPSANFYDGLGSLKDVDLTAASLGFKVVNTRGFNSTSPVRSLQIIDGVDNQAPGLNFSLGNFLGCSELDVLKVDLIVGASSAFYGPNAFNGVIKMETKSPFYHKGLSAMIKTGERNLVETGIRYADVIKNKSGNDLIGFKANFFFMKAYDWVANNFNPVDNIKKDSIFYLNNIPNPGRWDAVNIYGDEYYSLNDLTSNNTLTGTESNYWTNPGLRSFYRTGYKEEDLVDYNTKNYKGNAAVHVRLNPKNKFNSPELIIASCFGSGTTVYQGDNRFSLKNILFYQNRIEIQKTNKYFLRAYSTNENAGDSYDPYFTAIRLLDYTKNNEIWANNYRTFWLLNNNSPSKMWALGYPKVIFNPNTGMGEFDFNAAKKWLVDYADTLRNWHSLAEDFANKKSLNPSEQTIDFLTPGTRAFDSLFNIITSGKSNSIEKGTRFYDQSALYHVQGEYTFEPFFLENLIVGGNMRWYSPNSDGTIFTDSMGRKIRNFEFGLYSGINKKLFDNKLNVNLALRVDKNENFDLISSPAASLVYKPKENTYLRASFSSAVRNPTLTDQYLHLNVGRAILSGNLSGFDSLITVESFVNYLGNRATPIEYIRKDSINPPFVDPIRPERVKTFELGIRTSLFNSTFIDLGYYFSTYKDFIGYNIGIKSRFDPVTGFPKDPQAYRVSANSINTVQTQGFSAGINYYFSDFFALSGNYSYNKLIKTNEEDPIIPAFNTPENKYNLGFSGRDIYFSFFGGTIRNIGFNINYKWVQDFIFEGSPQFTGYLPAYGLMDAQINWRSSKWNTTFKLGASNLLNNEHYEAYGGPSIGRLSYFTILYEWKKK